MANMLATASNSQIYRGNIHAVPFTDPVSLYIPNTIRTLFDWCEKIWYAAGIYRSAMQKVVAFFATDLAIEGIYSDLPESERDKWSDMFSMLKMKAVLADANLNCLCYGNAWLSLVFPFHRYLWCQKCGNGVSHDEFVSNNAFGFRWVDFNYEGSCPRCRYNGVWAMSDEPGDASRDTILKIWNPHDIDTVHSYFSGRNTYYWRIPEQEKYELRRGNLTAIKDCPKSVLDAVRENQRYRFDDNTIFHMAEPTLAGIRTGGVAVPRTLWHARQIWYLQMMHCFNEAIAMEYIIPWRVITPKVTGNTDPLRNLNMKDWSAQISRMIRRRRIDPNAVYSFSFPLEYQVFGGEAGNLAPFQLMDQAVDQLLACSNVPIDLYRTTFSLQGTPPALRMMEADWFCIPQRNNDCLAWAVEKVSNFMSWERVRASTKRPSHVDDINRMAMLQGLSSVGKVSDRTLLEPVGANWRQERLQQYEEALEDARLQKKLQEDAQRDEYVGQMLGAIQQQGDPMAAGGDPNAAAGGAQAPAGAAPVVGQATGTVADSVISGTNNPQTPEDIEATALSIASELPMLSEGEKRRKLSLIRQKNTLLYDSTIQKMKDNRQQAESIGRDMVMAQQFGAPAGGS